MGKGTTHCTVQMALANVGMDWDLASEQRTKSQKIQLRWD